MALVEGAAPGAVTGIVKSLTDWFQDERSKRRLKKILRDPRYRFGSIAHLSANSGASPERTRQLLMAIGARPAETDLNIWTLRPPRVL
jgi:hypothetical protein